MCRPGKSFDRVDRELLWQVLERYGVRGRLKEAVVSLYLQSEARVQVQGRIQNGLVAQGE